ncbi:MAG: FtsW/RodA/SpoVE family cell cycle protein [Patescibacteria group bacterium]|nr:FtsW/RodA/SpoVE family cell cycle protein [Patescibacteria group bacterium]MDE2014994.1 FtsW/RodA/SpoVE family cell cycle protein [Patescibacteria group bacterium]MDE2226423.1 FtsW/RodA/SpoVE family cell cycle protein [Patescibacteria group bacterium]
MLTLFIPLGIILAASLVTISSISIHLFWLQILWIVIGVGLIAFFYFVDWHFILNYRWLIGGLYVLSVLLLLFVYLRGPIIRNIRSWIVIGQFTFQPVELAKIALVLVLAGFFSRRHLSVARWKNIFVSFIFFAVPAVLAAIEPELGSVLVFFGIWFGFLLLSGLPPRRVAVALLIFIIGGIFVWFFVFKDYHRERIMGFIEPQRDALGINYSSAQSKIAIGSGGLWGKGYGQGTQTQLGFLTEPASDFIFSALIEEWGAAGGLLVIVAFSVLIVGILRIGAFADNNFEKFLCLGTVVIFGSQFFLNAGSATGIMPVIGIPFPFLSYGGSNILANFFLLSIVNAISKKQ